MYGKAYAKEEKLRQRNWIMLVIEYPMWWYVSQLKELMYPGAYMVCFSKVANNSAMWGNYADYPEFFIPLIVLDYLFYIKNNEEFLLEDIVMPDTENYITNFVRSFALDIEREINMQGFNPDKFAAYQKARAKKEKKKI